MIEPLWDRVLAIACPVCVAGVGEWCRNRTYSKQAVAFPHDERITLARDQTSAVRSSVSGGGQHG